MTVFKKLQEARAVMATMPLKKSGKNKFAGYEYFELGDFLPTAHDVFRIAGLCGIFSLDDSSATLRIHDVDSGDQITFFTPTVMAHNPKGQPIQDLGSTHTYLRRYLWLMALELTENDQVDALPPAETPREVQQVAPKAEKKPYKVENPKPTVRVNTDIPGVKMTLSEDPMMDWQIRVVEKEGVSWDKSVIEATRLVIGITQSVEDVQHIYQVNKAQYERLKTEYPTEYAKLLDVFKIRKESFK
jgi:hypothetical protein